MRARLGLAVGLSTVLGACDGADPTGSGATELKGGFASACPAVARAVGDRRCVLDDDVRIASTIELGDGQTLDCQGHRILPTAAASGTNLATYVPSAPEVAVAIVGRADATLSHCELGSVEEPFDFPLVIANAHGNRIVNNVLRARSYGVKIIAASDNRLVGNDISWGAGLGMHITRNSDRNHVAGNRLRLREDLAAAFARENPGVAAQSNQNIRNNGIMVINAVPSVVNPGHFLGVINVVINGRLSQFPAHDGSGYGRLEDNKITGNDLRLPGAIRPANAGNAIYVALLATRTIVRDNEVRDAAEGVRLAGFGPAESVFRPARCVAAGGASTDRWCGIDADCFIASVDAAPVGTCPPPQQRVMDIVDLQAQDTLVERNRLYGPFNDPRLITRAAIVAGGSTVRGVIRDNLIVGTGIEAGITMQQYMIMTGTVVGNRVENVTYGLLLNSTGATHFGAQVSGNDFVGSALFGVGIEGDYTLPAADLPGNYWGHDEAPCFRDSDSSNPALVRDSAPSCAPVATAPF